MKFDETRETYGKIATLYYMGDQSQGEIAERFNISRFKVARVLKRCRELNIIEFRINNKPHYYKNLESQIEKLLSVHRCIIVSPGSTAIESKAAVGKAAAKYLEDSLKDGMMVGFDWGSTLQTMVQEYTPVRKYKGCLFVQISGSVASQSMPDNSYIDGHDIVKNLAAKAGADWSLFPTPYIVQEKMLHDMLLKEKSIKNHISKFDKLDIAFFGIGSRRSEYFIPFYKNYLPAEECDQVINESGVGELFSNSLDINGNVQSSLLTDRVLTIDLKTLKCIPDTIVLAAGQEKTQSLIAGARGKYFKTMIITEIVALSIIDFFEKKTG
jgi:DNA-binding transcriptional regulator LsrR (DeoR family)